MEHEDALSLLPKTRASRREFIVTSLAAGFALAVQPVCAQTLITTDTNGLEAGEVKIPTKDGEMPGYRAMPAEGKQLGTVAKKWAGLAKEFFTSADNYVIALNDSVAKNKASNLLLLAAGLAIDVIYKEQG